MATATPNGAVGPLLGSGWLTVDQSAQQATGRVPVTADDTAGLPNPQVPVNDDLIDYDMFGLDAGGPGEGWVPTTDFPWPSTPASGDGVVAVLPGATGNQNDNDDPTGMPGYDGPRAAYGGAYANTTEDTGYDAVAQKTNAWGFNEQQPGANMGYVRQETRLMGNTTPGYVNIWRKIWQVSPSVKTANQFTAQPFTNMDGTEGSLPEYANLGLANSGGVAYYVNGPEAPNVQEAMPVSGGGYDPAAGWA